MLSLDDLALREVGYGAGYLQYAVISACAQSQLLDSYLKKLIGAVLYFVIFLDLPGLHASVAVDFLPGKPLKLNLTRSIHALSDLL